MMSKTALHIDLICYCAPLGMCFGQVEHNLIGSCILNIHHFSSIIRLCGEFNMISSRLCRDLNFETITTHTLDAQESMTCSYHSLSLHFFHLRAFDFIKLALARSSWDFQSVREAKLSGVIIHIAATASKKNSRHVHHFCASEKKNIKVQESWI